MADVISARLLVEEVEAAGCRLEWRDGRPRFVGDRSRLSPTLWAVLTRWRRDEVAALLAPEGEGVAPPPAPEPPPAEEAPPPGPPELSDAQIDAIAAKTFDDGWPPTPAALLEVEPGRWLAVSPETVETVKRHNQAARQRWLRDNPEWAT